MADNAYLGAYESTTEIKVVINRELLEDIANYMEDGKRITISDVQFAVIRKKVYEAGLVSDFIDSVLAVVNDGVPTNEGKVSS